MSKRESQLVERLNRLVLEFLTLEEDKQNYYKAMNERKDYSRVVIETLYLKQCYLDTVTRRIIMLVDRLNRKDIDFSNEVAIEIYNYYKPYMKKGFDLFL